MCYKNGIAFFLIFIILTGVLNAQNPKIYINEVMASNTNVIHDDFFEYPDWIELYNSDITDVNLEAYSITDNRDGLGAWVFPSITIPAKGYLYFFASGRNLLNSPVKWHTVLDWGDSLKYTIPNASTSENWYKPIFDDSLWQTGKSGFGYGDNDDATLIPGGTVSVFLRVEFIAEQFENVKEALLHMDYDDAFVAYLNGVEIARSNIGNPGTPVAYNEFAATDSHEALMYQ